MKPIRWRLRVLFAATLTGAVVVALFIAQRAALGTLRDRLAVVLPPDVARRVIQDTGDAYFGAAFLLVIAALALGIAFGGLLSERIERLRADLIARIRGGTAAARMPPSSISEIQALSSAMEFLGGEFAERMIALARDRDELAILVNAVSEGILQMDAQGRVVRANPAATVLLRLPRNPRGQAVATLVRNHELRTMLEAAARGEAVATNEISFDEHRLLVVSRPFNEGSARGAVVALVELTQLRRLEDVRRDFVANVSHELKTPLTSIRGYVETLLSDELSAAMQRQFLVVVQKNAERLHRIVEDLLDLSRLESGGWRPQLRDVDPLDVARETWTACAEQGAAKSLTFQAAGDSLTARADPAGLRQVLSNLYDNAIRHTPPGGRITVRGYASSDEAGVTWSTLEVADTGAGIPRDALGRVFERFFRVDPARSRAEGGTGLGLSIVKHLVDRMGGTVEAESERGKGTTIRVRLPLAQPHDVAHPERQ